MRNALLRISRTNRGLGSLCSATCAVIVLGWADGAAAQAPSSEMACAERAREVTLLEEEDGQQLCRGAVSLAPVDCYESAIDRALIETHDAVRLCQCADSTEPVECFLDAREALPSDLPEALRLCSPLAREQLDADCRPRSDNPRPAPDAGGIDGASPDATER